MLSVNTVGLYNIVPSSAKNQRPRVFYSIVTAVAVKLELLV